MIWIFFFLISSGLLLYSYLLYPLWMRWLAQGRSNSDITGQALLPTVSIITAVYNEEAVLAEKIRCIRDLAYPMDKLHVYFGSDNSTDRSNELLERFAREHRCVTFVPFAERKGKVGVINQLGKLALERQGKRHDHILFYNDANVMLPPLILKIMLRHFEDSRIALVDANMKSRRLRKEGISHAEKAYISSEVLLKHNEGRAFGLLQGAFGGCYGLRSDYFTEVPEGFLVDDFFISFESMVKGGRAINDLDAQCFESASHDIWQEYNRKARISSGNFQNLNYFLSRWRQVPPLLWFCFFSHKVIRWFGPWLIITIMIASVGMYWEMDDSLSLAILLGIGLIFVVVPVVDVGLLMLGIHVGLLRKIRYFVLMNIALLKGFIRYAKGIRTSFWDPPKRV